MSATALRSSLAARIRSEGSVSVAEVMAAGASTYYARAQAFDADFVTAPEISQVFGELIGLWCAVAWQRMGSPQGLHLVECGPGRGTLIADMLRAGAKVPGFVAAAQLHLVERSQSLRETQRQTLGPAPAHWHDDLASVPRGPMILIANEFLDALPVRQFVRTEHGWSERHVTLDEQGQFAWVTRPGAQPVVPPPAKPGDVVEQRPAAEALVREVASRLGADRGAALFIDYGHERSAPGDTLQAVKEHRFHPVLTSLGEADLTAQVDFEPLARAARDGAAAVFGPVAQGTWLAQLGIRLRTAQLARGKSPERAAAIAAATRRLIAPEGMGLLFKVMAMCDPATVALAPLDGFAENVS